MSYITPDEARTLQRERIGSASVYPDELLAPLIVTFAEKLERYTGRAWQPRQSRLVIDGRRRRSTTVRLDWPDVSALDEVTINGETFTGYSWTEGSSLVDDLPAGDLSLLYTHGPAEVAASTKALCALYVAYEAQAATETTQANSYMIVNADGTTERRSTPDDSAGRPTGWMAVDRQINMLPVRRRAGIG